MLVYDVHILYYFSIYWSDTSLGKIVQVLIAVILSKTFLNQYPSCIYSICLALVDVFGVFTPEIGFRMPKIQRSDIP